MQYLAARELDVAYESLGETKAELIQDDCWAKRDWIKTCFVSYWKRKPLKVSWIPTLLVDELTEVFLSSIGELCDP